MDVLLGGRRGGESGEMRWLLCDAEFFWRGNTEGGNERAHSLVERESEL